MQELLSRSHIQARQEQKSNVHLIATSRQREAFACQCFSEMTRLKKKGNKTKNPDQGKL